MNAQIQSRIDSAKARYSKHKPASNQKSFNFDEEKHPRNGSGEFAQKDENLASSSVDKSENVDKVNAVSDSNNQHVKDEKMDDKQATRDFSKRHGTRQSQYSLGGTIRATDGTIHVITKVHSPRWDDSRSEYVHSVTTRPATEEESSASNKARRIAELEKQIDFMRHGPDDDRDRESFDERRSSVTKELNELKISKSDLKPLLVDSEKPEDNSRQKTKNIVLKGNLRKAADKLKSEGFVFDGGTQSWSKRMLPIKHETFGDSFTDDKGNFKGTAESILHMAKTYSKDQSAKITIED